MVGVPGNIGFGRGVGVCGELESGSESVDEVMVEL
jgi:hypothetical protein